MTNSTLGLDYLLESYIDNEVIPRSESVRDRFGSYWLHRQDLSDPGVIRFGRIVDYVPYANAYKVQADQQTTIWCTPLADTGLQPFGAKSLNTLPVGSGVFYFWYRDSHWGYILGVVPDFITDKDKGQSDYISPGSRAGILVDQAHRNLLGLQFNGGVVNWSAGRPVDATGVGEWGATTETGLTFFLDPYMAMMKVNESTGIWAFLYNHLLRIAGHNLQLRTALRESFEFDDQDEASLVSGLTPYPWERLGIWSHGNVDSYLSKSPIETQSTNPELARIEPRYTDQQAFMRKLKFEGYLGQGGTRMLLLPPCPVPVTTSDLNRYSVERQFPSAFEEHIALTGAYSLRSAKRVVIAKRWGVAPKQMILPQDENGDNDSNYAASGLLGSGPAHTITGELTKAVGETLQEQQVRAMAGLDSETWGFNWANLHQFYYHEKDWYLPEHSALPCGLDTAEILCTVLGELGTQQYMSAPTPVEIHVDHRYGEARYWLNESVFALTDDGGISIVDGYGVEWRSTGGSLDIFAPGDVNLHVGRSFNVRAGKDVNINGNNCVDILANNKDVRIKAEHNLMMLSGNDGCGGTLIENRAVCPAYDFCPNVGEDVVHSGIFLKAFSSRIVAQGADVFLEANCNPEYDGQMVLDTNNSRLRVRTEFLERFVGAAIMDFFVDDTDTIVAGNEWWGTQTILGAPLAVQGCVHAYGVHSMGSVVVTDGHIATSQASANNFSVSQLNNASTIEAQFTQLTDELTDFLGSVGPQEHDFAAYVALKNVHRTVEFSLRTTAQYGTTNYIIAEGRWQQAARLCETGATWTENPVITSCVDNDTMYPWPGLEVWCGAENYRTYDPIFRDPATGDTIDRDSTYQAGEYNTTQGIKPDGNYVIPAL